MRPLGTVKVTYLINGLTRGGAEYLLLDLIESLGRDVSCDVFCLSRGGPLREPLRQKGVAVHVLRSALRPRPRSWQALHRALTQADVLHSHLFYPDALGAQLARWYRVPWIVTRHEEGFWMNGFHRALESRMYRASRRIICVSQGVADSLRRRNVTPPDIEVVHPGVRDLDPPITPSGENVVLSVGRLERVKGQDRLLRAFAKIPTSVRQGWQLAIVGTGPEERRWRALSCRLGLEHHVRWLGEVPREALGERFAQAQVFVLPSRSEGLPLALLDAMAASRCCLAVDVGGVSQVIQHQTNGWLVDKSDAEACLTRELIHLMTHEDVRKGLGAAARQTVATQFSWERFVAYHQTLYRELAGHGG